MELSEDWEIHLSITEDLHGYMELRVKYGINNIIPDFKRSTVQKRARD